MDINPIEPGDTVILTAIIDDTITGMSNIASADWMRWPTDPTLADWTANGQSMSAMDGAFDEMAEDVIVTIPGAVTAGWESSTWHSLWVRGVDSAGNEAGSYLVEIYVAGIVWEFGYDIPIDPAAVPGDWVFVSYAYDMSGPIEIVLDDSVYGGGGTDWDVAKWYDPLDAADPWKTHRKGASTNDLINIDYTMGVWVRLTATDGVLTTGTFGDYSAGIVNINLYTGWNIVSYPSATNRLSSITLPPEANMVAYYDEGAPYLITDAMPDTVVFSEGNAYWVHVTSDTVWSVNP